MLANKSAITLRVARVKRWPILQRIIVNKSVTNHWPRVYAQSVHNFGGLLFTSQTIPLGPRDMRNYIRTFYGITTYHFIPNDQTLTQHFINEDLQALQSNMANFSSELDPTFFDNIVSNVVGAVYWKLNKENVMELITGNTTFYALIGENNITTLESPRDSWSHGE